MRTPAGKVALVTGGARRIGAAISRRLAGEGFTVALTYRVSRGEACSLAREIGGKRFFLDFMRPQGISRLLTAVEREFGRLDLLVHNAAVFRRTPVGGVSSRDWDEAFAVNLRGPFFLTRASLPLLRRARGDGAVLFIGDAGAGNLWPGYLPYCLSKLALERQAAAWRKIVSPEIRVGMVKPGLALIPEGFSPEAWNRLRARSGVRGPDSPSAVAGAVLRFVRRGRYNFPDPDDASRRFS